MSFPSTPIATGLNSSYTSPMFTPIRFDLNSDSESIGEEDQSPPLRSVTMETYRFMHDAKVDEYINDMLLAGYDDIFEVLDMMKRKELDVFFDKINMKSKIVQKQFKFYLSKLKNSAYVPREDGGGDWLAPGALFIAKMKKVASIDSVLKNEYAEMPVHVAKKILRAYPKERVTRAKKDSICIRKHMAKVSAAWRF